MKLGLQLYTVRKQMKRDAQAALARVKALGFGCVESYKEPFDGRKAAAFIQALRANGVAHNSAQVSFANLSDHFAEQVKFLHETDCAIAVVAMLPVPVIMGGADAMRRFCAALNALSLRYQKEGIRLCFHHHNYEFSRFGDSLGIDILLGETSESVGFVVDTYWAQRSGVSPENLIAKMRGRLVGIHLRDMAVMRRGTRFVSENCPLGEGTADIPAILGAAKAAGVTYAALEQNSKTPFQDIEKSLIVARGAFREWI